MSRSLRTALILTALGVTACDEETNTATAYYDGVAVDSTSDLTWSADAVVTGSCDKGTPFITTSHWLVENGAHVVVTERTALPADGRLPSPDLRPDVQEFRKVYVECQGTQLPGDENACSNTQLFNVFDR